MNLKTEFKFGKLLGYDWAGIYGYIPKELEIHERLGDIFAVTRIKTSTKTVNVEPIAKIMVDELQNAYYDPEKQEKEILIRLENAIWSMKSKMDFVLAREEETLKDGLDLEMAVCVVIGDLLYAVVIGDSKIFVKRGEKVIEISKVLIDAGQTGFMKSGSLQLEASDLLSLTTSKVAEEEEALVKKVMLEQNMDALEEIKSRIGWAFLMFGSEEDAWKSLEELPITNYENSVEEEKEPEIENDDEDFQNEDMDITPDEISSKSEITNLKPIEDSDLSEEAEDALSEMESESKLKLTTDKVKLAASQNFKKLSLKFKEFKDKRKDASSDEYSASEQAPIESGRQTQREEFEHELEDGMPQGRVNTAARNVSANASKVWNKNVKGHFQNNKKTYAHIINTIAAKVSLVVNKIYTFFKEEIVGTGDRRDIYLKGARRKRNRKILAIVLVVLAVVLFFGIRKAQNSRAEQRRVNEAENAIANMELQLQNLSQQVDTSKNEGEQKKNLLLASLNNLSTSAKTQKSEKLFEDRLDTLIAQVEKEKDELLLVDSITEPQIVADIGKVFPNASLSDLEYSNGNLFITDKVRGVVYKSPVNLASTPVEHVTGLNQPMFLVREPSNDLLVFDNDTTSSAGRFSEGQAATLTRVNGMAPAIIGKVAEAFVFEGNSALYELHQNHQQIFKRDRNGNEYVGGGALYMTANPPNWKTDPELANAIDISITFEVYVLIQNKGLRRYLGGGENTITQQTFVGLTTADFTALNAATSFDISGKFMAVSDPKNKRVLLFEIEDNDQKTLKFSKQYVYKGSDNIFNSIEEVVVNEASRKIYVLDGAKVIRLDF